MAKPKSQKPIVQPTLAPIPDINHNGTLDAQDLNTQLTFERLDQSEKPVAHAILESIGIRDIANGIYQSIYARGVQGSEMDQAAALISLKLDQKINDVSQQIKRDPEFPATIKRNAKQAAADRTTPPAIQRMLENQETMVDFATTFAKTFPHGIEIRAEQAESILWPFAPPIPLNPIMPIAPSTLPQAQKTRAR